MKKIHIIEISLAVALIISIISSVVGFASDCDKIRGNIVRLHILANSDSEDDQRVKLIVRDAILDCGKDLFSGNVTVDNAEQTLNKQKYELIKIVNDVLEQNGFDYRTQIYLVEEYFTTRTYKNFTLPAGEYLALKIILGKGDGHNWWCVMFPPLCLPAASGHADIETILGYNEAEIVQSYPEYEIKFKIIEIFEGIKNKMKDKTVTNKNYMV